MPMFRKPPAEPPPVPPPKRKPLTPAAERALAEAAQRRAEADRRANERPEPPKEVGGPTGPEPTRYGDWENEGAASDF
jgi:hypothetical protein